MDKVIRININFARNFTIVLLSFAFLSKIDGKELVWYWPYIISSPIFFLLAGAFFSYENKELKESILIVVKMIMVPYIVAVVYSAILMAFDQNIVNSGMRAISTLVQEFVIVFLVLLLYLNFQEDAMDMIIDAVILSYIYSLIFAMIRVGNSGFKRYLDTLLVRETSMNKWFEVHGVGLSIGILLLYEAISMEKRNWIKTILMIIILLICWKRIALMAFLVSDLLFYLTRKMSNNLRTVIVKIMMLMVLLSCYLYVMLISTGRIYELSSRIGFDFSNRKYLYVFISKVYEWSITFCGHGLGFVGKYLQAIGNSRAGAAVLHMQAIHSDILKMYIELGFIGSMLWFLWFVWYVPGVLLKKCGNYASYVYCLVTIYAFITYTTDNTMAYFIFKVLMYSLIIYGCHKGIANADLEKVL